MKIAHPQSTYGLNLSYGSAGTFNGWDRFGRIVEWKWTVNSGAVLDHETYAYDRNSNMTSRTNVLRSALNETYSFDGLDRLASMIRNGAAFQSWTLDGNGNWSSFTNQGATQTRTHNAANEVSTISGQTAPAHDAAGNLTQAPKPSGSGNQVYVFDGWNRLKQIKETSGTVIVTYEYDARSYRIEKVVGANTNDYFYNEASQIVEVRLNDDADPLERYIWDLSYIDTPVIGIRDTDTNGSINARMYYLWDATGNVTAVMYGSQNVVAERMHYDAYGKAQFYTAAWSTKSGTSYGTVHTFTGRELDTESGLHYFRARYWDPALGRFLARDPIGYVDGMNLYQGYFVHGGVDPSGLRVVIAPEGNGMDLTWVPNQRPGPWNSSVPPVFTPPTTYREGVIAVLNGYLDAPVQIGKSMTEAAYVLSGNNPEVTMDALVAGQERLNSIASDPIGYGAESMNQLATEWNSGLESQGRIIGLFVWSELLLEGDGPTMSRSPRFARRNPKVPVTAQSRVDVIDELIRSSRRPAREGSRISRGVQALQKKIDRGSTHFGVDKTPEATEQLIREIMEDVQITIKRPNGVDYRDSSGRGVRMTDGCFDTFL